MDINIDFGIPKTEPVHRLLGISDTRLDELVIILQGICERIADNELSSKVDFISDLLLYCETDNEAAFILFTIGRWHGKMEEKGLLK